MCPNAGDNICLSLPPTVIYFQKKKSMKMLDAVESLVM
jgi:hypothetical protein